MGRGPNGPVPHGWLLRSMGGRWHQPAPSCRGHLAGFAPAHYHPESPGPGHPDMNSPIDGTLMAHGSSASTVSVDERSLEVGRGRCPRPSSVFLKRVHSSPGAVSVGTQTDARIQSEKRQRITWESQADPPNSGLPKLGVQCFSNVHLT